MSSSTSFTPTPPTNIYGYFVRNTEKRTETPALADYIYYDRTRYGVDGLWIEDFLYHYSLGPFPEPKVENGVIVAYNNVKVNAECVKSGQIVEFPFFNPDISSQDYDTFGINEVQGPLTEVQTAFVAHQSELFKAGGKAQYDASRDFWYFSECQGHLAWAQMDLSSWEDKMAERNQSFQDPVGNLAEIESKIEGLEAQYKSMSVNGEISQDQQDDVQLRKEITSMMRDHMVGPSAAIQYLKDMEDAERKVKQAEITHLLAEMATSNAGIFECWKLAYELTQRGLAYASTITVDDIRIYIEPFADVEESIDNEVNSSEPSVPSDEDAEEDQEGSQSSLEAPPEK